MSAQAPLSQTTSQAAATSRPSRVAPLLSLTGDYFEMGTVLATRLPWWSDLARLRSDDLFRLLAAIARGEIAMGPSAALAIGASLFMALVLASWTYRLGILCGTLTRRGRSGAS